MSADTIVTLAEIIAPRLGSVDPFKHPEESFDLYSIPAFDRHEPETVRGAEIGSAKQLVQPDDVLLSRIVPHIRRAWVVGADRGRRLVASGEWIVFRSNRFDSRFLRQLLVSDAFHTEFMQTVSGVGGSLLRARPAHVAKIRLSLPPLPEQRRIAEILNTMDALRAQRRAALAQLDTLTQSIFLDMFGDPAINMNQWPSRLVSEYVATFEGGKSIDAEAGDGVVTRNRVLKVSAVTGMRFLAHESKPVPDSYVPPQEHFVRQGDLLFSRANTSELVGAVAYVDAAPPNVLLPDKLWRFVWRASCPVEPLFVWALFQTQVVRREIARRATGTSGSMKNISQEKLLGVRTIFPPFDLQRRFAERIATARRTSEAGIASARELDALFASLQHRAFRGEL